MIFLRIFFCQIPRWISRTWTFKPGDLGLKTWRMCDAGWVFQRNLGIIRPAYVWIPFQYLYNLYIYIYICAYYVHIKNYIYFLYTYLYIYIHMYFLFVYFNIL